jgi:ribose transport system substrate-binding protein
MCKVRRRALVIVAALGVLGISACSTVSTSTQAAGSSSASGQAISVTGVVPLQTNAYFISMCQGARAAAAKLNVKLTWTGTPTADTTDFANALNAAAITNPKGIIIEPFDPNAYVQTVKGLMSRKIYVVSADNSLASHVDVTNVRSDTFAAAEAAAQWLGEQIKGKGSVAVLSLSPEGSQSVIRVQGFADGMKKYWPGVNVLPTQYDGHDTSKAASIISSLLQAHPDLAAVYSIEDAGGDGAAAAIKAAGKTGQIKNVTFDAGPELVAGLKTGKFDALVAQDPYDMGYRSVEILAEVARGQAAPTSFPAHMQVGYKLVTRDNISDPGTAKYLYSSGSC